VHYPCAFTNLTEHKASFGVRKCTYARQRATAAPASSADAAVSTLRHLSATTAATLGLAADDATANLLGAEPALLLAAPEGAYQLRHRAEATTTTVAARQRADARGAARQAATTPTTESAFHGHVLHLLLVEGVKRYVK